MSDGEKQCFARFAVFAGGATIEATETITGADLDTLDGLVTKSLLVRRRHAHTPTRLAMLETIRAYATERFAAGHERKSVRERHYRHFAAMARREGTDRALWGAGAKEHLARLDAEIDNLGAALAWAVEQDGAEPALAVSVSLGQYWLIRERNAQALHWVERALSLPGADEHPTLRVRALCILGWALWRLGRGAEQADVMAEAEATARELGDPAILSRTLQTRAAHASSAGRIDAIDAFADEALQWARVAGDDLGIALAAFSHTLTADTPTELRTRVRRAASLLEAVGDVYHLATLYASACYAALCDGSDRDAHEFVNHAIPLARELDSPYGRMLLQGNIGLAKLMTGDVDAGRGAFREELRICRELRVLPFASEGLLGLAAVAVVDGDLRQAARLRGAATAHGYGQQQDAIEARLDAAFFATARSRHGADAWDAAVHAGAQLDFENAIACALDKRLHSPPSSP